MISIFGLLLTLAMPILLPAFWILSIIQLALGTHWFHNSIHLRRIALLVIAQMIAPFSALLLYPLAPGSAWSGEPLGISEKALNANGLSGLVCAALTILSLATMWWGWPANKVHFRPAAAAGTASESPKERME